MGVGKRRVVKSVCLPSHFFFLLSTDIKISLKNSYQKGSENDESSDAAACFWMRDARKFCLKVSFRKRATLSFKNLRQAIIIIFHSGIIVGEFYVCSLWVASIKKEEERDFILYSVKTQNEQKKINKQSKY